MDDPCYIFAIDLMRLLKTATYEFQGFDAPQISVYPDHGLLLPTSTIHIHPLCGKACSFPQLIAHDMP